MDFLKEVPPFIKEISSRKDVQLGCALLAAAGIAAWGAYKVHALLGATDGVRLSPLYNFKQELTPQEASLEKDFINKDGLCVSFDDVGGLEEQIREIEDLVLLPLSHAHLFKHSRVAQQPTGILLYGPPGTGKTMLAKAIATSAQASFLTVNVASVESKWFGETPKLIEAMFTLARKRAPCVMFIDEVDGAQLTGVDRVTMINTPAHRSARAGFLSSRHEGDMQHVNTMKTKFMEMWDGLATPRVDARGGFADWVLVIAATNKPWSIDPAVLRRMPRQIYIGLPDAAARVNILQVLLKHERASASCDINGIAASTEGYSGSDLRELVRAATLIPIREAFRFQQQATRRATPQVSPSEEVPAREITTEDLHVALRAVKPTGVTARQYKIQQSAFASAFEPEPARPTSIRDSRLLETPSGAAPPSNLTSSEASPDSRQEVVKAFLEFGPSSKLNSANLSKAVEDSRKGDIPS